MVDGRAKHLLSLLLLLTVPIAASAAQGADAQHYNINVSIQPRAGNISGTTEIIFDSDNLEVLELELDDDLAIIGLSLDGGEQEYIREGKNVLIVLEPPLSGVHRVSIDYLGALEEEVSGHGWSNLGERGGYAVYEADWYPHMPDDRAKARISLRVPAGWAGISNGAFQGFNNESNTFTWDSSFPEIGYSFAAGPLRERQGLERHWILSCYLLSPKHGCPESLKGPLTYFSRVLKTYPYTKLALVEVEGNLNGGHGDGSLIIMSSDVLRGSRFEEFLAHETAHSWFGGLVSSRDSRWLSEGFATYAAYMYFEDFDREVADRLLESYRDEYLKVRSKGLDRPILSANDEYDTVFHATVYSKGAYVLHMLRRLVGEEAFTDIIQTYLREYSGGLAGVEDFTRVSEEVSGMELEWFYQEWLNDTSIPDYWVASASVKEGGKGFVTKAVIRQDGNVMKMPVHITLTTEKGEVTKVIWMDRKIAEVEFETDGEPILIDIDRGRWILEENRLNNRKVLRYPLNAYGFSLLLETMGRGFKALF